jgi:predicted dehydrogenase
MNSMSRSKVRVGVVGCGNISSTYLRVGPTFEALEFVACADMVEERARARAAEFNIPKAYGVADLLADPDVELVLNLTTPQAHAEIGMAALNAGKHVYNEKPLAVSRADGRRLVELARERGLLLGAAPDTFMGAGIQTVRKLIDDGAIGAPVAATAFMTNHGHESWHPDPAFYYQAGGGPMFDMGPYYLTALVSLLGPVRRVSGSARASFPERTITSKPKFGTTIAVEVPTHVTGVLDFAAGAVGTIITSFDIWAANLPRIEIYGAEGTLSVPDPNTFGGPVQIYTAAERAWREVPLTHSYAENSRSLGVADMAYALRSGRPHRASGDLAFHILDIMHAFHESSEQGRYVELASSCERPAALPTGLPEGQLDP